MTPRARHASLALAALAACSAAAATPLRAQQERAAGQDTARWVADCLDRRDDRPRVCEVRDTRLPSGTRRFDVDATPNGGVTVIGWDGDSVLLRAFVQAQAPTDAEARDLARQVRITANGGSVSADGPRSSGRRSWSVGYELFVPRKVDVTARSQNGPVSARGVTGRLDLTTQNGPVTFRDVGGDVRGRTQNGPVTVELAGAKWDGQGLDAQTQNGPVRLSIPDGYSARLETGTANGPMRIDFPITVQGRINRQIEATLGSGGATVRAMTTNGPVVVSRS